MADNVGHMKLGIVMTSSRLSDTFITCHFETIAGRICHWLLYCRYDELLLPGGFPVNDLLIERTTSAYTYPLLIKNLLAYPVVNNPDQEIVYRDQLRFDYRTLRERICRLANALTALGVKPGDTVAVMDWDSHRYLECFFAVPMIGAVLHTINVRLSPDQILYTIDHAEDDVILVHNDFLPILEAIKGRIDTVHRLCAAER